MENKAFTSQADEYYNMEKIRMVPFFPYGPNIILDIGCANGRLGQKLHDLNKASELIGVEIFPQAADEAAKYYDKVYCGDIESLTLPYKEYFDFVICGDILEHLRNPWTILDRIRGWLKPNGILISSIPNIRFWRIIKDLMFFGKWDYVEAGILDNTHLRFFARDTFQKMQEKANFEIIHSQMIIHGKKKNFFNTITFSILEEFLGSQILTVSKKNKAV
jgi:2-polyprenyl-3-methyl-5-hydroxy-6-metoxy-1,4-benzoquinol methylase